MSLLEKFNIALRSIPTISSGEAFWYLVFAGGAWLVFEVLFRRWLGRRRIAQKVPTWRQMGWEFLYSLRSMAVFGAVGGFIVFAGVSGWTQIYLRIERYGWPWFFLSMVVMIFLHDAYFYWTHRLMHGRRWFRAVHRTHHLSTSSTSPSPWAAYSFSSWEALVQAGIGPLIVFTIPTHPLAFSLFMIWQITFNVFGHCGHEIWPAWFMKSRLGCFLNTPTHNAMHHESFRANYGLYFNIWDRLMGTNHPQYEKRFAQITTGSEALKGAA
jgi:sterol desaturase/sphingolipid hydroxylase (fatty acid hydroxylase superfamily)